MSKQIDSKQMLASIEKILTNNLQKITKSESLDELEQIRIDIIGRKSDLINILRSLKEIPAEERNIVGQQANQAKQNIIDQLQLKKEELTKQSILAQLKSDPIDITLPGKKRINKGHVHPVTRMQWRTEDIFQKMGFEVHYPYEIDDDYHNFISLNLPEGHPARDSWDTFWTVDNLIAITHTSSMQNRILSSHEPPIRAIVPGRCFRNEATDARHEHTFVQVEGVYVDRGISFNDMLGTLKTFFSEFFEYDIELQFSPDFFPFVEPGGMISLTCILCNGKGCEVCKGSGWLEVLGCGMIHPEVLKMAGIDPEVYTGFAWGFGLERLILLKYGIEDTRHFKSGKLQFIRQF